jgi:hypothetical protein
MAFRQFLYKFSLLGSAIKLIVSSLDVATRQHTQHEKKKKKGRHSSSPNHQSFSKPLHQGTKASSCFRIEVFSTSSKGGCRRIISEIQDYDRRKGRSIHTQFWRRQGYIQYEKTPRAEKTAKWVLRKEVAKEENLEVDTGRSSKTNPSSTKGPQKRIIRGRRSDGRARSREREEEGDDDDEGRAALRCLSVSLCALCRRAQTPGFIPGIRRSCIRRSNGSGILWAFLSRPTSSECIFWPLVDKNKLEEIGNFRFFLV